MSSIKPGTRRSLKIPSPNFTVIVIKPLLMMMILLLLLLLLLSPQYNLLQCNNNLPHRKVLLHMQHMIPITPPLLYTPYN
jgi:hypothetical protein